MFLAFFMLLMLCGGIGVLVWLGWQRIANHLKNDESAKKYFVEHIVTPLLLSESKADDKRQKE